MTKQLLNQYVIYYQPVYPIRLYILQQSYQRYTHIVLSVFKHNPHYMYRYFISIYHHKYKCILLVMSELYYLYFIPFWLMFISLFTFHIYPCLSLPLYHVQLITLMHNYIYFSMIIHIFLIPINPLKHYVHILSFTLSAFNTLYNSMLKHIQTHFITYLIPLIHITPYIK